MCNITCHTFVLMNLVSAEVFNSRVLEVGSRDVNGSVRPIVEALEPQEYIGVDIVPGKRVDRICRAEDLVDTFGEGTFGTLISTEAIEHIEDWRAAISNMKRVLCSHGILIITTRSKGFPYHGYPGDYWRYSVDDMKRIFSDMEILELESDPYEPGVFIKARKPIPFVERDLSQIHLYSMKWSGQMRGQAPHSKYTNVPGWETEPEQDLLHQLAGQVPEQGRILEIGGEFGMSASIFCKSVDDTIEIVTVDLFPDDLLETHLQNLNEAGFGGRTVPIQGDSREVGRDWPRDPIDLLFIDGDHSYEGVKADLEIWPRFIVYGGVLALHDYAQTLEPGRWHYLHYEVRKAIDEWFEANSDEWEKVDQVDSIIVFRRLTPKPKAKAKAKAKKVEDESDQPTS